MKNLVLIIVLFYFAIIFTGCSKSKCDECTTQKREFCLMMFEVNCNSAYLTTNIDNLVRACGTDEANKYISAATDSCTHGTLACPEECE